jgi:maltose/moltooligosaccharide transporter
VKPSLRRTWTVGTLTYTSGGLAVLVGWLLWGDFAWWMRERSAMPMVQVLLRKFEASDLLTGVFLITLPSVTSLIIGPIVSYWSDRHRGPRGRRIPFLLATTPLVTLAMVLLGLSAEVGAALHRWIGGGPDTQRVSILVVIGLGWTLFEMGALTANAVFGALINDVVPRELIGRFFGVFRAVSLATGVFFNSAIIGHAEVHYREIFIGIGVLYAAGLVLMCLKVKEGEYPPPAPREAGSRHVLLAAVRSYLRVAFSRAYYVWGMAFFALGNLAFVPVNTYMLAAARSFGLSMEAYGRVFVVMFSCSFVLAYPLGWLADRFHPLRVGGVAIAAYGAAGLASFVLVKDAPGFAAALLAHGVLSGCFFTGTAAVCQVLFPKLNFAQFAAAAGMANSILQILLGPVLGWFLDLTGNDYRYAFLAGSVIAGMTLTTGVVLLRARPPVEA